MQSLTTSSTPASMIMELPAYGPSKINKPMATARPGSLKEPLSVHAVHHPDRSQSTEEGMLPSPVTANPRLARWNESPAQIFRVLTTFYSFIILGANDGAYGALIPYLETYYKIDYTTVSLVFLSPIVGYVASATTNNMIHTKFGQRGIAIVMSLCHLAAYIVISLHPPYPVLVIVFMLSGYGCGLGDSAWNAWIGDMTNANEVLGILHGFYGLGAAISPLVATTVITKAGWQWYQFYYVMVGGAVVELLLLTSAFWKANGAVFRAEHPVNDKNLSSGPSTPQQRLGPSDDSVIQESASRRHSQASARLQLPWYIRFNPLMNPNSRTAEAVKNRVTLTTAFFLLIYVGVEVSIGGWIVTFMLRVRGASPFASGLTSTGFWLGVTVGRFVLGFVTGRLFKTEKHAVAAYLCICFVLQLLLWLVPQFLVSAVMVGLLGFFLAPMFPAAVVVLTKLLPKYLHVASIGFAAAFGASGACVLPFAVGAIANAKGVQVLQPIILAMLVVTLGIWLYIPKLPKQRLA